MSALKKFFANKLNSPTKPIIIASPTITEQSYEVRENCDNDTETILEVFKSHWHQAEKLMEKHHIKNSSNLHDFEASLHYIDEMIKLIAEDVVSDDKLIIHYLFNEHLLEKMVDWTLVVADLKDRFKIQQLHLYEFITVTNIMQNNRSSVLRPLLRLLYGCMDENPVEVERKLLLVLHQLCICVYADVDLLQMLFDNKQNSNFQVLKILTKYVHRDGDVGQQARDSLLLIMILSEKYSHVGYLISSQSDFCPVLATGLSGLYSELPRKLDIPYDDWYQLTTEDIAEIPALEIILNSLEFCNAVVQVAHSSIKTELINYIYEGFLVPVLGPALYQDPWPESILERFPDLRNATQHAYFEYNELELTWDHAFDQINLDVDGSKLPSSLFESYGGNSAEEVIAATAYLELFLRRLKDSSLIKTFIKFIFSEKQDDTTILDSFIKRISSQTRLSQVTLNLFYTIIDLNIEECMFHLIYKYLLPCSHIMVSQKRCVKDLDVYCNGTQKFLTLIPSCCIITGNSEEDFSSTLQPTVIEENICNEESTNNMQKKSKKRFSFFANKSVDEDISNASINNNDIQNDMKLENYETDYNEYLIAARQKLQICKTICEKWKYLYDGKNPSGDEVIKMPINITVFNEIPNCNFQSETLKQFSNGEIVNDIDWLNVTDLQSFINSIKKLSIPNDYQKNISVSMKEIDLLIQCNQNVDDNEFEQDDCFSDEIFTGDSSKPIVSDDYEIPSHLIYDPKSFGNTPTIGPFLTALFLKLDLFMQNSLYVNLVLTAVISRLTVYPQALLKSFLLNPNLVYQPSIKNLIQILSNVKNKIDCFSYQVKDFETLLIRARRFLIWRDEDYQKRLYPNSSKTDNKQFPTIYKKSTSFTDRFTNKSPRQKQIEKDEKGYKYTRQRRSSNESTLGMDAMESVKTKNAVYSAVILEEFVKELAAISEEHNIVT